MEGQQVVLGYWKIRGLAQAIRYCLEYADVKYTEVLYEQGEGPEFSRESWLSEKNNLGLDFPNLPYFIDGDLKFTESNAIIRYIAHKWCQSLNGKTNEDFAKVEMVDGLLNDIKSCVTGHCYRSGDVSLMKKESFPKVEALVGYLADKNFLIGDYVTYVDFIFYEIVELLAYATENLIYDSYPILKTYKGNVEKVHGVCDFIGSERFIIKFNNKIAKI